LEEKKEKNKANLKLIYLLRAGLTILPFFYAPGRAAPDWRYSGWIDST